jgi:hypothetical protein
MQRAMKPNKRVLLSVFTFISLLSVTNCKKGEDDPLVSLRSRKERLVGDWRLQSGTATYTQDTYRESYIFDGSNVTLYVAAPSYAAGYKGKYFLNLNISKDGKFIFKELLSNVVLEASGTWNFNVGVGKEKKKEDILFYIDKVIAGYTNGNNLFNRTNTSFVYKIKELRNKKMVITSTGKIYSDSRGKYTTLSNEYIFIQ